MFEEDQLPQNQNNLEWVTQLNKLIIGKDVDDSPAAKYFNRNLYFASDLAWACWHYNLVFKSEYMTPPTSNSPDDYVQYKDLRSGDLAFWSDATGNNKFFDNIHHVGIISKENDETYLYEVTYYVPGIPNPYANIDLITENNTSPEDFARYNPNNVYMRGDPVRKIALRDKVPQPSYFGRLRYDGNPYYMN